MIVLGIDPDTKNTGVAIVDEHKIHAVGVLSIRDQKLTGDEAVRAMCRRLRDLRGVWVGIDIVIDKWVVESQEVYKGLKQKAKPADMIRLAQVAGAAMAQLPPENGLCPTAGVWKHTVTKGASQGRALQHYGIPFDFVSAKDGCRPIPGATLGIYGADTISPAQWKHVGDAIALALWGVQVGFKAKRVWPSAAS